MTPGAVSSLILGALQTTAALLSGPKQRRVREVLTGIASALSAVPAAVDDLADGWDDDDVGALGDALVVALDAVPGVRTHEAERIGHGVAAAVGLIVRLVEKDDGGAVGETVKRQRKIRRDAVANRLPGMAWDDLPKPRGAR